MAGIGMNVMHDGNHGSYSSLPWVNNIMGSTIYFLAGNEPCPQPQTSEHLAAIEIMKLKHILILQNKIDLIKEEQAKQQQQEILR